jgi:hypothetical protein
MRGQNRTKENENVSSEISRREFIVAGIGALNVTTPPTGAPSAFASESESARLAKSPFKISVIADEISQDFGHACEVAAHSFGMGWVEIRSLWKKNIANLDAKEIAEVAASLKRNNLRVTDVASPLFKVDWPGPTIKVC